jgi:polar amino acid transport system substrate-binding protein
MSVAYAGFRHQPRYTENAFARVTPDPYFSNICLSRSNTTSTMTPGRAAFLACVCLSVAMQPKQAVAEKLLIYSDHASAPVISLEKGKPAGFLSALLTRLSKDSGDTYELVLVPWKRALYEAGNGRGGIAGISWTRERAEVYDFSQPVFYDDIQLVVLKGKAFAFSRPDDLKGKTVGGLLGTSYGDAVDKALAAGNILVDRDQGQVSRLKKLLAGHIDVAIIGNGAIGFEHLLASDPDLSANRDKFFVLPKPLAHDSIHLAFAKTMNMKPALARFDKALAALKKTAEYQRLVRGSP